MSDRPSGSETRDALAEVLEDQAARKQRREAPAPPPKDRGQIANVLIVPVAVLTFWFVVSPPSILRPAPVPAPTFEDIRTGLEMDIYAAAAQVFGYVQTNGRPPAALVDALTEEGSGEGLQYSVDANGVFEISGERMGQSVVYRSTQSLREFVAAARTAVRAEGGS